MDSPLFWTTNRYISQCKESLRTNARTRTLAPNLILILTPMAGIITATTPGIITGRITPEARSMRVIIVVTMPVTTARVDLIRAITVEVLVAGIMAVADLMGAALTVAGIITERMAGDLTGFYRRFMRATVTLRGLLVLGLHLLSTGAAGARGLPASQGITNFGKVDVTLYRGAQPDENGIKNLKALGVTTIINLRMPGDAEKAEPKLAVANGIQYTNVPLAGVGRPTDAEVAKILSVIQQSQGPVFIHCEHGCDRTGTIVACYRIQHDGWSYAEAMKEAEIYGLSPLERGMRKYIADFSKSARLPPTKSAKAKP